MKHIYLLIGLLLFPTLSLSAQEDLKPLVAMESFRGELKRKTAEISSIESDFTQEKYLEVFNQKIVSKGRFYYKQPHLIRMDYSSPLPYLMVINGERLKIVSEGKTNVINLGSNQLMKEMKSMIAACMTGDLENISSAYALRYFETSFLYVLKIEPLSKNVKAYLREMVISLDKNDMSVMKLRMTETETDYTEFHFNHKKYNTITGDEMFAIP